MKSRIQAVHEAILSNDLATATDPASKVDAVFAMIVAQGFVVLV